MLLYAVLAAALPLALACSCPPAPAGSEVCGSDLVTYDSLCHLQCAAVPGLSLKHPGPCSATEEVKRWDECTEERQCEHAADCGCGDKVLCNIMCKQNCRCGCSGYPRGSLDVECHGGRMCGETYNQCKERCIEEQECEAKCLLDYKTCLCQCLQQAYPARQRRRIWTACLKQRQCAHRACSECQGADPICAKRCEKKCQCECAGHPRRDLLSSEWEECFIGTQSCKEAHSACVKECGDQACRDKCYMARVDCRCECRTATEAEWRLWGECTKFTKGECRGKRCSECLELDTDCVDRCQRNCLCGCLGINADSLDVSVQQCQIDNKCQTTRENCLKHCDTHGDKAKRKECEHSCILASEKCYCECARSHPPERVKIIQHCNFIC